MNIGEFTNETQTNGYNNLAALSLLSINEVRKLLKVRHSTVTELINEGKLKALKLNNRYKIPKLLLEEFLRFNSSRLNNETNLINIEGSDRKEKINELINKKRRI